LGEVRSGFGLSMRGLPRYVRNDGFFGNSIDFVVPLHWRSQVRESTCQSFKLVLVFRLSMFLVRSYSHHSLLSAVPQVPALVADAKSKGYSFMALTDEDTGSGLIDFYDSCKKNEIGFCPAATLRISNLFATVDSSTFGSNKQFSKIAILSQSNIGYKNLVKLISTARVQKEDPKPHLDFEDLTDLNEAFVLITNENELHHNLVGDRMGNAQSVLDKYLQFLSPSDILVELFYPDNNNNKAQTKIKNLKLIQFCQKNNLKYLVSPAPRYLTPDDEEVFRAVLAVRDGKKLDDISLSRTFELPSLELLKKEFDYCPEAFDTDEIENRIKVEIRTDYDKHANEAFFPHFELPPGQTADKVLIRATYLNLISKFSDQKKSMPEFSEQFPYEKLDELKAFAKTITPNTDTLLGYSKEYWKKRTIQDYIDRIDYELDVIITKGFPAYFLVFADLMFFCRENNIVTNTRGSGAGCLVSYLNRISILDPLVYDIPFERFLNPLRPSAPDIDGDFADDKRDLVVEYITKKYGADKVCQIITFGAMLPRAAVRDLGRVLGVSYTKCDKLSKIIPNAPQGRKTTFKWALETSQELTDAYEKDEDTRRIIDLAKKIEGNYRHASVHAAGVIIAPTTLTDYMPLQWDSDHKMVICQYDMRVAEKVGLVKMDILGIANLAILGNAVELAEKRHEDSVDLLNINLSDPKAFELLTKGRTMGLFQLSGPAMTRYLIQMQPNRVHDLMAMVALYRPGPMANIPDYIKRKHNPSLVKYYVPQMEKWMQDSYGVLVYQDDVLYSAINLAGYDWAEVDVLRKGMGKKIKEVIDAQHIKFVEGCQSFSGFSEAESESIWDLVVPFSAYGFNKAHAASYGMIAYWTAYMKAEYQVEFMTSLMTSESNNLPKVAEAINECKELGIEVLPPDVNKSLLGFNIENDKTIRYGLASVKNLGVDVIKFMITERDKNGDFQSLEDFLDRLSPLQQFNKKGLEALIFSGSLDGLRV
jgi:DNA polymerase III subunit alpha